MSIFSGLGDSAISLVAKTHDREPSCVRRSHFLHALGSFQHLRWLFDGNGDAAGFQDPRYVNADGATDQTIAIALRDNAGQPIDIGTLPENVGLRVFAIETTEYILYETLLEWIAPGGENTLAKKRRKRLSLKA